MLGNSPNALFESQWDVAEVSDRCPDFLRFLQPNMAPPVPASGSRPSEPGGQSQPVRSTATQRRKLDPQAKLAAKRARNRVNQARYRERQAAKATELETQHRATRISLSQQQAEHESLAACNTAFEQLLVHRNESLAILQAATPPNLMRTSPRLQRTSPRVHRRPQLSQLEHPRALRRKQSLGSPAVVEEIVVEATDGQPPALAASSEQGPQLPASPTSSGDPEGTAELLAPLSPRSHAAGPGMDREAAALRADKAQHPEVLERMLGQTAAEFVEDWRGFQLAMRDPFIEFRVTQNHARLNEIITPLIKRCALVINLAVEHRPDLLQALFATAELAPTEAWEQVISALEFSPQQRMLLHRLWTNYQDRMRCIRAHQSAAVAHLACASQRVPPSALGSTSLSGLVAQYLEVLEDAKVLDASKLEEFTSTVRLLLAYARILTPLQRAHINAASHPNFPDVVSIVRLVAQQHAAATATGATAAGGAAGGDA